MFYNRSNVLATETVFHGFVWTKISNGKCIYTFIGPQTGITECTGIAGSISAGGPIVAFFATAPGYYGYCRSNKCTKIMRTRNFHLYKYIQQL